MICFTTPLRTAPFFITLPVTMMAIASGSGPFGGLELFPGLVLQVSPHVGIAGALVKPLNDWCPGDVPALTGLFFHHCAPQKFTRAPVAWAARSPMTNAPPAGNATGGGTVTCVVTVLLDVSEGV